MEIVSRVKAVYGEIDQQVAAFQLATGLRCSSGCGSCCTDADVHTTALEMLPSAHEILCRGESAFWLERIEAQASEKVCVFYQHHPAADAQGHCAIYAMRPAICRLFGFAAVRDRKGAFELAACKYLKQSNPDDVARARSQQSQAPCFTYFGTLLETIDLSASALMPINEALRYAILRLGLQMQMSHSEALGSTSAA